MLGIQHSSPAARGPSTSESGQTGAGACPASTVEGAGFLGEGRGCAATPPGPGPHPCPNGNISTETLPSLRKEETHSGWKTAYLVRVAILDLVKRVGLENVGMYTFTFAEHLSIEEAQRRWDSFNTHIISQRYPGGNWVKTLEMTKGTMNHPDPLRRHPPRPHFHWIGHVPGIRVGCVMGAVTKGKRPEVILARNRGIAGDGPSAVKLHVQFPGPVLVQERHFFASVAQRYGFGSWNDISPIKADDPARAAQYAAKYVVKSFGNRPAVLKGKRLVSFGKGVKPGTTRFSSIGGRAGRFREGVALFCLRHGYEWEDLPLACEAFHAKPGGKYVGHRWAYFMREDFERCLQEFEAQQPF